MRPANRLKKFIGTLAISRAPDWKDFQQAKNAELDSLINARPEDISSVSEDSGDRLLAGDCRIKTSRRIEAISK